MLHDDMCIRYMCLYRHVWVNFASDPVSRLHSSESAYADAIIAVQCTFGGATAPSRCSAVRSVCGRRRRRDHRCIL